MAELETLLDGRAFLEGPRWHAGALFVSDMHAGEVLRVAGDGVATTIAEVPGCPSGLGWTPDGTMLVVSMEDRRVLRREDDRLEQHADCSSVAPNEINDMVVDGHGHAFISQFGFDFHRGEKLREAPLLRVDPDGAVQEAAAGFKMANGMAITADGATLVVAESAMRRLVGFDLAGDGSISNRRIWAELPEGDYPDGICIDAEDAVWVAGPASDRCVRVREGGDVLDVVETPGRHAIACAIGGDDGHTLFLCTSPTHGQPDESREARGARVEVTRVSVPAP